LSDLRLFFVTAAALAMSGIVAAYEGASVATGEPSAQADGSAERPAGEELKSRRTSQPAKPRARTMEPSADRSYRGPLPPLSEAEVELAAELRRYVERLAGQVGERNLIHYKKLVEAADWLEATLTGFGYQVRRQTYDVQGRPCHNLDVELEGSGDRAAEIVIVGAHYDSVAGSPGANDNGSGVAALLSMARRYAGRPTARTLRLVLFANEEPPYFQTGTMGSRVYARDSRRRGENIVAVISLETMGYYSDAKNSQKYPPLLRFAYPSTGNFIGFVGNVESRPLVDQVVSLFRRRARFPSEKAALPSGIPGVGWSDHWAFWQEGYPGLMVTDTAPFRYPDYHTAQDTPDKVDYDRLARVVAPLSDVIAEFAGMADKDE
jgi:hypothetical protein